MSIIDLNYLRSESLQPGENREAAAYIDQLYNSSAQMFLKQHKDWYINRRFVSGEHWIVYNKALNRVQQIPVVQGEVRRTINKIRTQVRGVKNFIKRSQPRWEVQPDGASDEDYEEAKKQNKILQKLYREKRIKKLLTNIIVDSMQYSIGILELGVTINKIDGSIDIDFWSDDPFDVIFDPYATDVQGCRFIFKTFVKPIDSIRNNPDYKIAGDIQTDNKEAAAEYKNLLEMEKYNKQGNRGCKDLETAIVKELWLKWVDKNNVTKVRAITKIGNNVARIYDTKYRKYPIFIYAPETVSGSIYGDPWIKDLISPNKSLDKTVSQIEAYIQRMLAGKYIIKKGVEVSTITDKGAEKIYYKGSIPPVQQNLQPLPAAPFNYINKLEQWIEEGGGTREASLGRVPGSLQSGKAVEALQAADAGTVSEPVENLELMLEDVAETVLDIISDYTIASKKIVEDGEEIKYIGANLPDGSNPPSGTIIIKPNRRVKVAIVPEVAYSEQERKEWLMRLAEAKLIDPKTVLERFQFSNIEDIMARVKLAQEEEYKKEIVRQRESHRTDGAGPEDTADMADQENMALSTGQVPPLTPRVLWTPEHLALHVKFVEENRDAYEQNQQAFDEHIQNEESYS